LPLAIRAVQKLQNSISYHYGDRGRSSLINFLKIKWAEDLTLEIISFKSKYEGVKNGRSKRIE
jgi:hypothetical protein